MKTCPWMHFPFLVLCCLFVGSTSLPVAIHAQNLQTPLERSGYGRATPHDSLLTFVKQIAGSSSRFSVESIGTTAQGRDIPMVRVLPAGKGSTTKVLLLCQQHGNEPSGKEAVLQILRDIAVGANNASLSNLDLFIIPSVNPDGNESKKRTNANGADLNRDHLLLSQPETRAIHGAFARVNPDVTLDVHEYFAYRKEFRAVGYVRSADEQFGAATNLNVPATIREFSLQQLFPYLDSKLQNEGLQFSNYLKMDGPADTARASTTAIDDGRQSFAILRAFSFILEGKNGREMNDELERRSKSQKRAIELFLTFVNERGAEIRTMITAEQSKLVKPIDSVVVRMDYICNGTIDLPMRTVASNADTIVAMRYSPAVKPIASVRPPTAYHIPKHLKDVIALLDRHGMSYTKVDQPSQRHGEVYTVQSVDRVWMENKVMTRVGTRTRTVPIALESGDVIVPLNQRASQLIVIALEPSSMWGIVQYDEFSGLCEIGKNYPISRIID